MARRDIKSIIERTTGVARGSTQSARGVSQALGKRLGRSSYIVYNVDTSDLSNERIAALIESTGNKATKRRMQKFRISRLESQDFTKRTKPTDAVSGERLNIYRDMKAYQITFS